MVYEKPLVKVELVEVEQGFAVSSNIGGEQYTSISGLSAGGDEI